MLLVSSARAALKVRKSWHFSPFESINVFDVAATLGFEVRFVDLPSVEGMYVRGSPPAIIVSSLRPLARQTYTCAHEIGHHILDHGEVIDGILEARTASTARDPKEREADTFAAYLLMPPTAIDHALHTRALNLDSIQPAALYGIANYFQVGYSTLVRHLQLGLKKISQSRAEALLRFSPSQIRAIELGESWQGAMFLVDEFWNEKAPLDCEIGDLIGAPLTSVPSSPSLREITTSTRSLFEATERGISNVQMPNGRQVVIRVSPKRYVGRLEFRWEKVPANVG